MTEDRGVEKEKNYLVLILKTCCLADNHVSTPYSLCLLARLSQMLRLKLITTATDCYAFE